MPLKATERDVYEFFSQAGKVSSFGLPFASWYINSAAGQLVVLLSMCAGLHFIFLWSSRIDMILHV